MNHHSKTAVSIWLLALLPIGGGCSLPHSGNEDEKVSIPECQTYLTQLQTCLTRLGPEAEKVALEDVGNARKAFLASGADDASKLRLKTSCVAGLDRLNLACR